MEYKDELREPLLGNLDSDNDPAGIPVPCTTATGYPPVSFSYSAPYATSPIFGISPDMGSFGHSPSMTPEVLFLNIDENTVFDKVQCRRGGIAKMRVQSGIIRMLYISHGMQVLRVRVFVFREPAAAELHGDSNGKVELASTMGEQQMDRQYFSVNLDSVYDGPTMPVYKLAKVEMEARNRFQVAVRLEYIDGRGFQEFTSRPFLMRSKPRPPQGRNKRQRLDISDSDEFDEAPPRENMEDSGSRSTGSSNSPDSGLHHSDEHQTAEFQNLRVVEHLEANRAHIDHLTFRVSESTQRADIGYHFRLNDPHACAEYEEGDVVGFFKDEKGKASIELLDNSNASDAFMAGVITRSAYIEAKRSMEKGSSDVVCVIGVVNIKVVGSVRAGERVYSTVHMARPGTAIPESHLPPGVMLARNTTLLGMTLEDCSAGKPDQAHLVKCFACIVMGVVSKQLAVEMERMYDHFDMLLMRKLKVERKKNRIALYRALAVMLVLLGLVAFLLFQLYYPGSALKQYECQKGSLEGHTSQFMYVPYSSMVTKVLVHGVEFPSLDELKHKSPDEDYPPLTNTSLLNSTWWDGGRIHYYLNVVKCAGVKDAAGPIVYAINHDCTAVFYYRSAKPAGWVRYRSVHTYRNQLRCRPAKDFKT